MICFSSLVKPIVSLIITSVDYCGNFISMIELWHDGVLFRSTGAPARTVGWRDPGFIHTSFLKDLWPNKL